MDPTPRSAPASGPREPGASSSLPVPQTEAADHQVEVLWQQSIFDLEEPICSGSLAPAERKQHVVEWCAAIVKRYGRDDGTEQYRLCLTPYIERVLSRIAPADAGGILDTLSHHVCSKPALAFFIEARVKETITPVGATAMFTEGQCSVRSKLPGAESVVSFLTQPLPREEDKCHLGALQGRQAVQFHREYWAQDKGVRDAFIGELFLVDTPVFVFFLNHHKTLNSLLTSFLPPPRPDATDERPGAQRIGFLIGSKFAELAKPADRAAGLSAVMTAIYLNQVNPPSTDPEVCFGWRLATFLRELGPGTTKAGQYGDSLWMTPVAWLEGLRSTKFEGSALTRAETWRYVEEILPPGLYAAISLGRPVGHGSYLSNYEIALDNAYRASRPEYQDLHPSVDLVLSILKPNAREDALRIIDLILAIFSAVEAKDVKAKASIAPLRSIVEQGRRMVADETDLNTSKVQETLFRRFIDAVSIWTNGVRYDQYSAGAFEVGARYRTSRKVDGAHVNDWVRQNVAVNSGTLHEDTLNIFIGEVYAWITGRPVCHDRHLDNISRTEAGEIGHFDPGARAQAPPTPHMLRSMSNILVNALLNSRRNRYSFGSSLKYTLSLAEERNRTGLEEVDTSYLFETQRMIISWGDLIRVIDKRNFLFVALAIARTGKIAKPILSTVASRFVAHLGLIATDAVAKRTPFVVPALRAAGKIPGLSSISAAIREEAINRANYYPDNPNPTQPARTRSEAPKQPALQSHFTPPRISIIDKEMPFSVLGICVSALATVAEYFMRRRYAR
jgi:hypothetical protein